MTNTRHDEKVTVRLKEPLVNVGRHEGGFYNKDNNTTVFSGEVKVDAQTAEDLERRKEEWQKHQDNLHRDNGQKDLNAGGFTGNQA